jgi:hypothetical protein
VHYVVSGAGGKLRTEPPRAFAEANTVAWAAEGHFLLVQVDGDRCRIRAVSGLEDDGSLRDVVAHRPDGSAFPFPIEIRR